MDLLASYILTPSSSSRSMACFVVLFQSQQGEEVGEEEEETYDVIITKVGSGDEDGKGDDIVC